MESNAESIEAMDVADIGNMQWKNRCHCHKKKKKLMMMSQSHDHYGIQSFGHFTFIIHWLRLREDIHVGLQEPHHGTIELTATLYSNPKPALT